MARNVQAGELFTTFTYNGKDCADMGVYSVTSGSVYTMNVEPIYSDETIDVPAYDGRYYYGTQITHQQFQFNCFCHDLTVTEYNAMRDWLHPRTVGKLILTDQPFKYYIVKVVSVGSLGAIPLTTRQTPDYTVMGDAGQWDPVYTGSFTVTFETIGSAYAYGLSYLSSDLIYDAAEVYGINLYYDSGLIHKDMMSRLEWNVEANALDYPMPIYNPGSATAQPILYVTSEEMIADNGYIQITNADSYSSTVIEIGGLSGEFIIDTVTQSITDSEGVQYYGRFTGTTTLINARDEIIYIPESYVLDESNADLICPISYDTFYIQNNVVSINPLILEVSDNLIGRYFCVNENGGSKILDVDLDNNALTLDSSVLTYDIPPATTDEETGEVTPAGFAYNYIEVWDEMPTTGSLGDVCTVDGVWYLYSYDQWAETNLFSSSDEFKDIFSNYQTVYRMFGATILDLNDITITTGTNINYSYNGTTQVGASVGELTVRVELQPRYL